MVDLPKIPNPVDMVSEAGKELAEAGRSIVGVIQDIFLIPIRVIEYVLDKFIQWLPQIMVIMGFVIVAYMLWRRATGVNLAREGVKAVAFGADVGREQLQIQAKMAQAQMEQQTAVMRGVGEGVGKAVGEHPEMLAGVPPIPGV